MTTRSVLIATLVASLGCTGSAAPSAQPRNASLTVRALALEVRKPEELSLLEAAKSVGALRTLIKAMDAAGMADSLDGEEPVTLLAPTDQAFAELPPGTLETWLEPEHKEHLRSILAYHVIRGALPLEELQERGSVPSLQGASLAVAAVKERALIQDAKVIQRDIRAKNGIIQVIDTVMMPPLPE